MLGIAFGTIISIENGVILASGVGIGALRDSTGDYHSALWCLAALGLAGFLAAAALRWRGLPTHTLLLFSPNQDRQQTTHHSVIGSSRDVELSAGGSGTHIPLPKLTPRRLNGSEKSPLLHEGSPAHPNAISSTVDGDAGVDDSPAKY